jgi:hypothetical protein
MINRIGLCSLCLVTASGILAADLIMRPGRWEMTVAVVIPGAQEAGVGSDPTTAIDCITENDVRALENPDWLTEGFECTASSHEVSGNEVRYRFVCEEDGQQYAMDYRLTFHSPDRLTGTAVAHGVDATQQLTMKIEGKRTGDACSAEELAVEAQD